MSTPQSTRPRCSLIFLSWLPLACLATVEIYASNFDGWGAWATAPLFLLPLILSLFVAGTGLVRIVKEARTSSLQTSTIISTLIALLPLLWLLARRYFI